MTLLYNGVMLLIDLVAVWLLSRCKGLLAWGIVIACSGGLAVALADFVAGRFESHFGFFRLSTYGIFLHGVLWLLATAWFWRRVRLAGAVAALAAAVGLLAVAVDAFWIEPYWLDVTYTTIASPKIHQPLRIVVLADLQTDRIGPFERSVLRRAMAEKPDVILLAGDYLQAPEPERRILRSQLNAFLREIDFSAPQGVFVVRGNVDPPDYEQIFDHLDATVVNLRRKSFDLGDDVRLTCLSRGDSFHSPLKIASDDPDRFHIVLGHAPNFALGKIEADLLIAGHTHGGQIRLPLIGPTVTHATVPNAWAAGMIELSGGRRLYVSRGIGMERGHAPPMRFLCRPELTVLDLVPQDEKTEAEGLGP